jgi:uncharacterized linocin/CFP29 family protein
MSHLLREHAPISDTRWKLIDEEARQRLEPALAVRRLVDFACPHGWEHSATNLGRVQPILNAPEENVEARQRRVLALAELRVPFTVAREELRDADRGARDADLRDLDAAAHPLAVAENRAVLHGWAEAGMAGIAEAPAHDPITLGDDCARYPRHVAKAVELLLCAGIGGPDGIALGSDAHTRVLETSEHGGYPLLDHLRAIAGGPLVWAPGVEGALVISMRGGDFLFEAGQDISIGYERHDTPMRCTSTSRKASASRSRQPRRPSF